MLLAFSRRNLLEKIMNTKDSANSDYYPLELALLQGESRAFKQLLLFGGNSFKNWEKNSFTKVIQETSSECQSFTSLSFSSPSSPSPSPPIFNISHIPSPSLSEKDMSRNILHTAIIGGKISSFNYLLKWIFETEMHRKMMTIPEITICGEQGSSDGNSKENNEIDKNNENDNNNDNDKNNISNKNEKDDKNNKNKAIKSNNKNNENDRNAKNIKGIDEETISPPVPLTSLSRFPSLPPTLSFLPSLPLLPSVPDSMQTQTQTLRHTDTDTDTNTQRPSLTRLLGGRDGDGRTPLELAEHSKKVSINLTSF